MFKLDFLQNGVTYEETLFYIFDSFFHAESYNALK